MAQVVDNFEIKFRISDGTDIAHSTYASSTTVADLKQKLVAVWPKDKAIGPKSVNDVKLIHAGKFLENNKTLAESQVSFRDGSGGGVVTMHVVVQLPVARKIIIKKQEKKQIEISCSCCIL